MVKIRCFSLIEVLIAMTILSIMIIPIFNLMRQSTGQSDRSTKQLCALILAETMFENFRIKYHRKAFPAQHRYDLNVRDILRDLDCNFNSSLKKEIIENYKALKAEFIFRSYIRLQGSNSVKITISWLEKGKRKSLNYCGTVVAP